MITQEIYLNYCITQPNFTQTVHFLNLDTSTIEKLLENIDSSFLHEFEEKTDGINFCPCLSF